MATQPLPVYWCWTTSWNMHNIWVPHHADRGSNYILVITDISTRFKFPNCPANKVSCWDCTYCCAFPLSKIIQSDTGYEFCDAVVRAHEHHRCYSQENCWLPSRANGTTENAVGSTLAVLKKITNGNMTDWDLFLSGLTCSQFQTTQIQLFGVNVDCKLWSFHFQVAYKCTVHVLERSLLIQSLVRHCTCAVDKKRILKSSPPSLWVLSLYSKTLSLLTIGTTLSVLWSKKRVVPKASVLQNVPSWTVPSKS